MTTLPQPTPITENASLDDQAAKLVAAVEDAMRTPTAYRDDTPLPQYGPTPPAPQPGRPAMSQKATDASVVMLAGGGAVSMVAVSAGVLMYLSQYADPVVCGLVLGAPTAAVLALARLVSRAKQAAPDQHHHHYNGTVVQDHSQANTTTNITGVWAKNVCK